MSYAPSNNQYPQPGYPGQGYPPPGEYQDKTMAGQYNQQPMAQPGMSTGGNRNSNNLPIGPSGRPWSFDLCDCFGDAGTCVLSWFCPCVVYGQNKRRYEHLSSQGTADPEHGGGFCSGDCCLHACLLHFGLAWVLQMSNRSGIRARYQIDGSGCGDCLTACCCTPCELTQGSRELELEEKSLGGPHGGMMRGN